MGLSWQKKASYVSLKNKKFSLRSNLTVELSKYIKMNVNLDANQSNDKRFYWPFSDDDDQAVYDLYRCTFNAMKTTPFYSNFGRDLCYNYRLSDLSGLWFMARVESCRSGCR